jgi:phosphoribosyl-ATP pyrophosphohydrolase
MGITRMCYYPSIDPVVSGITQLNDVIDKLMKVLESRKNASPDSSYVAKLHSSGLSKILEKVGEESFETVIAAKDAGFESTPETRTEVIKETADLWFHTLVMLSHLDISAAELLAELESRLGTSGLVEKASRQQE